MIESDDDIVVMMRIEDDEKGYIIMMMMLSYQILRLFSRHEVMWRMPLNKNHKLFIII